jgi:hypothetical protein
VGEPLHGTKRVVSRSRGKKVEHLKEVRDPAIVLAIFPGDVVYDVVTNHRLEGDVRSAWENPFMAGRPTSVTFFSGE